MGLPGWGRPFSREDDGKTVVGLGVWVEDHPEQTPNPRLKDALAHNGNESGKEGVTGEVSGL